MNVIVYNEESLNYIVGEISSYAVEPSISDDTSTFDGHKRFIPGPSELSVTIDESKRLNNIELDPTTMERIAKFNKEQEIRRLDEEINKKKEKIKELDDILQDKDKRVQKLKEFVANIYNIDVNDDDDEEDYDDFYY